MSNANKYFIYNYLSCIRAIKKIVYNANYQVKTTLCISNMM